MATTTTKKRFTEWSFSVEIRTFLNLNPTPVGCNGEPNAKDEFYLLKQKLNKGNKSENLFTVKE